MKIDSIDEGELTAEFLSLMAFKSCLQLNETVLCSSL